MRTEEGKDDWVGVGGIGHGGTNARLFASDSSGLFWTNCFCLQGLEQRMETFVASLDLVCAIQNYLVIFHS